MHPFGGWALQGYLVAAHCRDTARLGIAGILRGWALLENSAVAVGHCVDTLWWALQGYLVVGHCRDILRLGTAGILCGCDWALRGYSAVGHGRDTVCGCGWALCGYSAASTAGILGEWALQGYSAVGHCVDTLRLDTAGIRCH